jgi:hypothetical protein
VGIWCSASVLPVYTSTASASTKDAVPEICSSPPPAGGLCLAFGIPALSPAPAAGTLECWNAGMLELRQCRSTGMQECQCPGCAEMPEARSAGIVECWDAGMQLGAGNKQCKPTGLLGYH